jgi:sarcosine oxidase subunit alpha
LFDGATYQGLGGDTLASALLANGVHLVGRSYKYHRPRGILSAGAEEPNALVAIDRGGERETPNLRATQVELYDGLSRQARTAGHPWPSTSVPSAICSLRCSRPVLLQDVHGSALPRLQLAWKTIYEPLIRQAAGLGKAPRGADSDRYASRFAHCDVLVIGAGPAGLRQPWRHPKAAHASSSATNKRNSADRCWPSRQQ